MNAVKRNDRPAPGMGVFLAVILHIGLILTLLGSGCSRRLDLNAPRKELDYTVCPQGHLPGELQDMVNERKKRAGSFSYNNSKYTYLVVCYGSQEYSGYSIRVEECSEGDGILYLRTQLMGPAAGEPVLRKETWPYIVIRCGRSEKLCVIES